MHIMRKHLLLMAASAVAVVASSAPLTPELALQRLNSSGPAKARSLHELVLAKTVSASSGKAGAYIFTHSDSKGFAILSADDAIAPVLGYSESGSIDVDNLPPALEWWIDQCSRKADYLQVLGKADVRINAPAGMQAVQPLCKTIWNQDAPYNDECPEIKGSKTPTGCVATSIAQAMKYFNYPDVGSGSITYVDPRTMATRKMDFSRTIFKWDKMIDDYAQGAYSADQAKAVAVLMKAAGHAVQMGYGLDASGAQSWRIPLALIEYFGYDKGTYYTERELYSSDEWTKLIYDNIKNVGPVIYSGTAIEGGHSFICDGYDGNGYFHFNWGWGGMSDGYYVLDSLLPGSQGIGGAGEGGFNYRQGAVLGMQKPADNTSVNYDRMKLYGTAHAEVSGGELVFSVVDGEYNIGSGMTFSGWGNASYRSINVNIGASFARTDSPESAVADVKGKLYIDATGNEMENVILGPYTFVQDARARFAIPAGLADGEYKVTLVSRQNNVENAPWLPVFAVCGAENHCILSVSGGTYTVRNVSGPVLEVQDCIFTSPLYVGRNAHLKCTFKNDSDTQITLSYVPVLLRNDAIQYQGDYMLVTVDPRKSVEKEMNLKLYTVGQDTGEGTYKLSFLNTVSGRLMGDFGDFEMTKITGSLKVVMESFEVSDAEKKSVAIADKTFDDVYVVKGAADVNIVLKYFVESGYLDSNLKMILAAYDAETGKFVNFPEPIFEEKPYIGTGHSGEAAVAIDMSGRNLATVYRVNAGYVVSGKTTGLGSMYFGFDISGVSDLESDTGCAEPVYFNLQGVRVDNPAKGQLLVRQTGSKVEKIVF